MGIGFLVGLGIGFPVGGLLGLVCYIGLTWNECFHPGEGLMRTTLRERLDWLAQPGRPTPILAY